MSVHDVLAQKNVHDVVALNSKVVRPWINGMDIVRRPSDTWIIDFGVKMSEKDASLYELPFKHLEDFAKGNRKLNENAALKWWLHTRPLMYPGCGG
ncbi:MAG TPA: hypothetical protein DHO02_01475, partial [Syntrophaceae bacterium]|nr:hypothetical protein [Syntrophaceae bacterium]